MIEKPSRKPDCPCTEECIRHGFCKECRAYHAQAGDLPYCKRVLPSGDTQVNLSAHSCGHLHGHPHGHEHGHPAHHHH